MTSDDRFVTATNLHLDIKDAKLMAAEPAPPTDGLREELARWWADRHDLCDLDYRYADQILALPGIRRLIAAEEALREVRDWDSSAAQRHGGIGVREFARRALDGDPK